MYKLTKTVTVSTLSMPEKVQENEVKQFFCTWTRLMSKFL